MSFSSPKFAFWLWKSVQFGNLQFHFRNVVKLWNFAIWFHKMSFLTQKAVSILENGLYVEI